MKTLNNYITERLNPKQLGSTGVVKQFPLAGAYGTGDLIRFASKFSIPDDPEDPSWYDWDDKGADSDWVRDPENLATVEYFCNLCKKMINSKTLSIEERDLGNFYWDEMDNEEIRYGLDIPPTGHFLVLLYTSDGDDGRFLILYSKNKKDRDLIMDFAKHTTDPSGWEPQIKEL